MINRSRAVAVLSLLVSGLAACGGDTAGEPSEAQGIAVDVQPRDTQVVPSGTVSFAASVTGTADTSVIWEVVESTGGTVDQAGGYTAPRTTGQYHVRVSSRTTPTALAIATITVTESPAPPPPPPTGGSCGNEPMRATGTVYYYCDCGAGSAAGCVPGNDSNAGTSPSAPRRTGWKSRFTSMAAGSTVALCRGGAFANDTASTHNPNCRTDATCDLRDYTDPRFSLPGGETRPILQGGRAVLFYSGRGANQGFRFFNFQVTGSNTGQGAIMAFEGTTDVDICNVYVHDGDLAVYWADPPPARWTVRQSQFASLGNAILGGCTDCVLDSNYFGNTSYSGTTNRDHNVYVSGHGVQRMRVTNNEIHSCRPDATAGTVSLVVHGSHEDLLIENNLLVCDNPAGGGDWGIQIDNGSYTDSLSSYYRRSMVRRNRLVNFPTVGIALSQAPDSIVEDNILTMYGSGEGINLGSQPPRVSNGDDINTRLTVRNNTVHYPNGSGRGIIVGGEGSGHVVTNNVMFYAGVPGTCFALPLAANAYAMLANNACNGTWGTTYDTNRVPFTGSPFVSAGTDYAPAAGGPLVGAGTGATTCTWNGAQNQPCFAPQAVGSTAWSATDSGITRVAPIDIGAYRR